VARTPQPQASPAGNRSDARNGLSNQLGHPIGWSPVFSVPFFRHRKQNGRARWPSIHREIVMKFTRQPAACRQGKGMRLPCPLCHANFVRRKCHGAAWLTVSGTPAERSRRAGDGAASSPNGVAAVSAAHDNTGSRHSFRRCRTELSCIAANSCNSRTWHRPQSCLPR